MKALVKAGPGTDGLRLMEVQEPEPNETEVKIRIHTAGICGTDLHIYHDEYPCSYPVTLGHEFAGTVVETGTAVTRYISGDRVVSLTAVDTCGSCRYCNDGLVMLCDQRRSIGSGTNGAFAEFLVVPEHALLRVPQSTSLEEATLFEPFACVVRSVLEVSTVHAGDTVLVCGPGTIGQLVAQVARVAGGTVYVAGTTSDTDRLALAQVQGAARSFVVSDQGALDKVKEEVGPYGFDVVYECSGASSAVGLCMDLVRKQGLYVQVGLFGKNVAVDFDTVLKKELTILSSFGTKMSSWERAITLVASGIVSLAPYVSEVLPLSEWQRGFARAIRREGYKILLDPATNRT